VESESEDRVNVKLYILPFPLFSLQHSIQYPNPAITILSFNSNIASHKGDYNMTLDLSSVQGKKYKKTSDRRLVSFMTIMIWVYAKIFNIVRILRTNAARK